MYATFQNMSDRTKLLAPVALCALALLAVSLLNWSALERRSAGRRMPKFKAGKT